MQPHLSDLFINLADCRSFSESNLLFYLEKIFYVEPVRYSEQGSSELAQLDEESPSLLGLINFKGPKKAFSHQWTLFSLLGHPMQKPHKAAGSLIRHFMQKEKNRS